MSIELPELSRKRWPSSYRPKEHWEFPTDEWIPALEGILQARNVATQHAAIRTTALAVALDQSGRRKGSIFRGRIYFDPLVAQVHLTHGYKNNHWASVICANFEVTDQADYPVSGIKRVDAYSNVLPESNRSAVALFAAQSSVPKLQQPWGAFADYYMGNPAGPAFNTRNVVHDGGKALPPNAVHLGKVIAHALTDQFEAMNPAVPVRDWLNTVSGSAP